MEKILKRLALIIALFSSCNAYANPSSLKIPLQTMKVSLDPSHIQDLPSLFVSRQVNCQLMRNSGSVFTYDLAKSIKYISPFKIEVVLKQDVQFHDGSPVTAQDVAASFEHIRQSRTVMRNIFAWVDNIEVKSDHLLVFNLKKPIPQFVKVLSSPNYAIFKKSFIMAASKNSNLWLKPMSCGDYRIEDESSVKIELTPVKNGIPITFYYNNKTQISADDISNYDIIGINVAGTSDKLKDYNRIEIFDPSHVYLGLNLNSRTWKSKDDRCAFLARIRNDSIIAAYHGKALNANDLLPVGSLGYSSDYQYFSKIKKQYQTTGLPKKTQFCLTYLSLTIPEEYREVYFNSIKRIYPNLKTISMTSTKKFGSDFAASDCDALLFSLKSNYLDGYEYLQIYANNDANFSGYNDAGLINEIKTSQNSDNSYERSRQYRKVIEKIDSMCIVIPLVTIPMRAIYVKSSLVAPGIGVGSLNEYALSQVHIR